MDIPVYKAEANLGLTEVIQANSSIAYYCPIKSVEADEDKNKVFFNSLLAKALLANTHDGGEVEDFYHIRYCTKSILATSNCNKNDDVFTREELWGAKNTSVGSPTNLNHDASMHVGHISECHAEDVEGNNIPENTKSEDLPDVFHLVNSAIIHLGRGVEEFDERADKLVAEIKAGTKFVSMECLFNDFDYAVVAEDGSYQVINRNEQTAFLTKHLRAYGGKGVYEDKKIGRVLKNIFFSGKGYVDRPANPDSIIFSKNDLSSADKTEETVENSADGVNNIIEDNTASDCNIVDNKGRIIMTKELEAVVSELRISPDVDDLRKELAEVKAKLAKVDSEKFEVTIAELKAEVVSEKGRADKAEKDSEETKASLETAQKELEEKIVEFDKITAEKAELDEKIAKAEAEKVITERTSVLVDGGVDKEVASDKVKLYAGLNDEQFEAIAKDIVSAVKVETVEETEETEGADASIDENEDNADLETVEASQASDETIVNPSDENVESNQDQIQTKLQTAIAKAFGEDLSEEN